MKIGPLGGHHTDCLKSDGSTFASRGLPHTVCLRSDGSAFACGSQDSLQVDVLQISGARQGMLTKLLLASHISQCRAYTQKHWNSSEHYLSINVQTFLDGCRTLSGPYGDTTSLHREDYFGSVACKSS